MTEKQLQYIQQEGTSQAGRSQKALDPQYVLVDERSIKELLEFAREYSKELNYFNEQNEKDGNWSGFLGDDDLDAIVRYLNDPERLAKENGKDHERFQRPHLVLFLTFLELLQHARSQINDLTRRHLEFYYREALRLTSQKGVADHVHVLVELVDGQDQFLIPAGTLLQAGQDSEGNDLFYRSDEDLIANQATIESIKSIYAQKQVIGLHEARQRPEELIKLFPQTKDLIKEGDESDSSFMAMVVMALGTPGPGGSLDAYPGAPSINLSILNDLDKLLDFIPSTLHMPISTFRLLMQLKSDVVLSPDPRAPINQQWDRINVILENAGKQRDSGFHLDRSVPDHFEKNLLAALGRTQFSDLFNQLPDVEDIYDLYRRRERADVIEFIEVKRFLHMSLADFNRMMNEVEEIHGRWRQIYEILRAAQRRKDPDHVFAAPEIRKYEVNKFNLLIQKTLGTVSYPAFQGRPITSFDEVYAEIISLENYFHMPAEKFISVRTINAMEDNAQPWEWEQVYAIFEESHSAKAGVERQKALKEEREQHGFDTLIRFALGHPQPGDPLPESKEFKQLDPIGDEEYINNKLFLAKRNFEELKVVGRKEDTATEEEWGKVYAILEQAQRSKRNFVDRARIENWENLYAAPDASLVQVSLSAEGESTTPRWRTFGSGYSPESEASTVPGRIGFAIASPVLALAEGLRTITLTLGFAEEGFDRDTIAESIRDDLPLPFQFLISSEEDMLVIKESSKELIDTSSPEKPYERALQFTFTLGQDMPPIVPLVSETGIQTIWPVLQILLADIPENGRPHKQYRAFQSLKLEKVHIHVNVEGITSLLLQDDESLLDSKKPFEPWGLSPMVGSSLYIAHPELCSKMLDELSLRIDWLGVPDDFPLYYKGYENYADPKVEPSSPIEANKDFTARLKLHDNRSAFDVADFPLFNPNPEQPSQKASETRVITVSKTTITDQLAKKDPNYLRNLHPVIEEEVLDWKRYWQIELRSDFLHALYPHAALGCANKKDTAGAPKPHIVNPPYTPKIKKLTAGYKASLEIDLAGDGLDQGRDKLYHLEPFGYRSLTSYESKPHSFLPQYDNEGELFIGIKNLAAPQHLSLLFQLADGSADPDVEHEQIDWFYLSGDQWKSLPEQGRLLGDTTNGLLNSGIVKFNLPAIQPSTLLPANLYWIRATVKKNSRGLADTVAIKPQAVRATFADRGNAPDYLLQGLLPDTISGLAEAEPEVRAIHQPYSSFGGRGPEQPRRFYTRVSERLRHKDRALTCWDYEHMVLEAFPNIYKVKCLPAGTSEDPGLTDVVQIIVIPDIRGKLPFDPFEPKAPADVLRQVEQFLIAHSPPFCKLRVKNPTYVRLMARLSVRFREGADPGYYKSVLNRELQQYLSPWAYDQSADIVFGNQINPSLIVNFVDERPYIDYVAGLKLFTSLNGQDFTLYTPPDGTVTNKSFTFAPDAILVSNRIHQIDLITQDVFEEQFFTGINYMKIELDFEVG